MENIKSLTLCILILVLLSTYGCVQMRDYTSARDGAFCFDVNKGFDQGVDKKDYYVISEDIALIVGDTKNDVIFKLGLPTKIKTKLDGSESWMYEEEKIDLFFSGKRLRGWSCSRYEETKVGEEK